ncbi:hypothetical protein GOP47_0011308 [Adiantum capillus-veneris]|uniref:Bifunctional inhibitor/plant lipid transfer protein/seed storage helical domain-containing protein n=1 Tax=Adiantum capillus-veneris TaxID=13818 RepID=A0A9D4USZ9_ADICA|nr:hypothetical protein GOP47_0011308 [Adiantum capillus-veneris]
MALSCSHSNTAFGHSLVVSLLLVSFVVLTQPLLISSSNSASASAQPDDSCISPLESLFSCLPYAQGKQVVPTATCCTNIDNVFRSQKKCLCELIIASSNGASTGLPAFNRTLAIKMPSACNVPADPSLCPGLLGIPPSSPEAKDFLNAAPPTANETTLASPSHNNTSPVTSMNLKSSSPSIMDAFVPLNIFMGIFVMVFL